MTFTGRRHLPFLPLAMLLVLLKPAPLLACAVCFGEPDAPMTQGLAWAIIALAGIIGCVLSGVVVFFVHIGRKSSRLSLENSAASSQANP